jgi:hypothetical protein
MTTNQKPSDLQRKRNAEQYVNRFAKRVESIERAYQGCTIRKTTLVERFFNKCLRGGADWSNRVRVDWDAYDENGQWIRTSLGSPRMKDCKRAIDLHIVRLSS